MKVLLVGEGAREHVIAEKLAQDAELYSVMSRKNPAIAQLSKKYWIAKTTDPEAVANAVDVEIDLAFSSPDATLEAGVSDALKAKGMLVASPLREAARIEWDKSYMRGLMEKYRISGQPKHKVVNTEEEAINTIKEYETVAIKPLGLTGGKGVKVSGDHFKTIEEKFAYAQELIKKDGSVLIEEKLIGEEFTLQAFCDGSNLAFMPPVQDHKRAFTNDEGPNTGGMGAYSTGSLLPFMNKGDLDEAQEIMRMVIHAMKKENNPFTGILYGQFMLGAEGPKVIEFNARFGDPEAMNVLSLLKTSLTNVFLSMADGNLEQPEFSEDSTVVKYLVPEGYPGSSKKDEEVKVDSEELERAGGKIYYASVYENEGKVYTTSSRSFGILGKEKTIDESESIAESSCSCVSGPVWHREDIGTKELIEKRIEHMKKLREQ
jgi:phosphoribosylamine--glycine ligase